MSTQLIRDTNVQTSPSARPPEAVDRPSTAGPVRAAQINEIVERLGDRYPREQISVVDLRARVGGFYRQFDGARLRSFVAILVEGLVRRSIAAPGHSPDAF